MITILQKIYQYLHQNIQKAGGTSEKCKNLKLLLEVLEDISEQKMINSTIALDNNLTYKDFWLLLYDVAVSFESSEKTNKYIQFLFLTAYLAKYSGFCKLSNSLQFCLTKYFECTMPTIVTQFSVTEILKPAPTSKQTLCDLVKEYATKLCHNLNMDNNVIYASIYNDIIQSFTVFKNQKKKKTIESLQDLQNDINILSTSDAKLNNIIYKYFQLRTTSNHLEVTVYTNNTKIKKKILAQEISDKDTVQTILLRKQVPQRKKQKKNKLESKQQILGFVFLMHRWHETREWLHLERVMQSGEFLNLFQKFL